MGIKQTGTLKSGRPDWVEWQEPGSPGWWVGVCDDPPVEARGRSLALLRANEDLAIKEHRSDSGCMWERWNRVRGHAIGSDENGNPIFSTSRRVVDIDDDDGDSEPWAGWK